MDYFFILGCHRSGTTMLQQALNRHSQIAIPPETKYFASFLGHARRCQVRRLARINKDLQITLPAPSRAVREPADARAFFTQLARAYVDRLGKRGVVYFGEKTPTHSGYLPRIKRVLPEAKFVWLYRDGRDVALSMRKVPWLNRNLGGNFLVWLFYYRQQQRAARDETLPILFVKYEELVARPEKELARVTDFLGLPFEPAVAFGHGNREGILEWEYPWKRLALRPITGERVGTWRKELSAREVERLEWLGGRALQNLGYPLATPGRNLLNILCFPRVLWEVLRFAGRVPLDEAANQFLGRAICWG